MKSFRNGIIIAMMFLVAVSFTFAMGGGDSGSTSKKIVAGMATDVGGLGDGSFNDGSYAGIKKAQSEGIATARIVESKQMTDYIPNLTGLAEDGANLVFAVGFLMQDAVVEAANKNPKTSFAGIDMWFNPASCPKNLVGITWREQEAGYLAGVVAGLMTLKYASASPRLNKKNVVGCILGMDIPPCERYEVGFRAGVKSVNPDCVVLTAVAGRFDDQAKGKELTLAMVAQGADIVFQIAGQTGLGVIAGAKEAGILAIGVDVDQYSFAPDTVLTSALKGLTVATYEITRMTAAGQFTGGQNYSFGVKEGAVDIAPFHNFDSIVPKEVKDAVGQAKSGIASGSIVVPDTRAKLK
jgi:basic membrane protein A